jgi:hypothetical protein
MKKVLIPLLAALMALVVLAGVLPVSASDPTSVTLDLIIDGRDTAQDIGDVVVNYDGEGQFTVVYTIDDPTWTLVETHVYLGEAAPAKSAPGKFPYTAADTILLTPATGATVYVAAHAQLEMEIVDPETGEIIVIEETGWAQSAELSNIPIPPGKNWATYIEWVPVP